jgi:hypothetical protein
VAIGILVNQWRVLLFQLGGTRRFFDVPVTFPLPCCCSISGSTFLNVISSSRPQLEMSVTRSGIMKTMSHGRVVVGSGVLIQSDEFDDFQASDSSTIFW